MPYPLGKLRGEPLRGLTAIERRPQGTGQARGQARG